MEMIAVAAHSAAMTADCASSPGRSDPAPPGVDAGRFAFISSILPAFAGRPRERAARGSLEFAAVKLPGWCV
jgi:hypothetical protein